MTTEWAKLVRHEGRMRLLDRVVASGDCTLSAEVKITPDATFYTDPEGVPAWIGIEYLAQAVAALAGVQGQKKGEAEPPLGYLLGTRNYRCKVPWFTPGMRLLAIATEELQDDNGLGSYDCRLMSEDEELAHCRLTVFRQRQQS